MSELVLVDTSVFISYLRGEGEDTLSVLILNNQVLLSAVVRLELLAGVDKFQLRILAKLFDSLHNADTFAPTADCETLLRKVRGSGLYGGLPDLMILADAIRFNAMLHTTDLRLERLAQKLKVRVF